MLSTEILGTYVNPRAVAWVTRVSKATGNSTAWEFEISLINGKELTPRFNNEPAATKAREDLITAIEAADSAPMN